MWRANMGCSSFLSGPYFCLISVGWRSSDLFSPRSLSSSRASHIRCVGKESGFVSGFHLLYGGACGEEKFLRADASASHGTAKPLPHLEARRFAGFWTATVCCDNWLLDSLCNCCVSVRESKPAAVLLFQLLLFYCIVVQYGKDGYILHIVMHVWGRRRKR